MSTAIPFQGPPEPPEGFTIGADMTAGPSEPPEGFTIGEELAELAAELAERGAHREALWARARQLLDADKEGTE